MAQTVLEPTKEILNAADLLDEVIRRFLTARMRAPVSGKYEADVEANLLLLLVIRHVEGVVTLARRDLVLLPPGWAAARAAFECSLTAAWLLQREEPFAREERWLAHLKNGERFYRRVAKRLRTLGDDGNRAEEKAQAIQAFRREVEQALPAPYAPRQRFPTFDELVTELGVERTYLAYMVASQPIHGTHVATEQFRRNLGNLKETGDFTKPSDWHGPLEICWYSLASGGSVLLARSGGKPAHFLTTEFSATVQQALNAVQTSG